MRRVKKFEIKRESSKEQGKAGRYNPCLEFSFRNEDGVHTHKIGAGYLDEINVYTENGLVFLLNHHSGLGHAGLEVFKGRERIGDVFLHGEEMDCVMGPKELSPVQMIRRLKDLLPI